MVWPSRHPGAYWTLVAGRADGPGHLDARRDLSALTATGH